MSPIPSSALPSQLSPPQQEPTQDSDSHDVHAQIDLDQLRSMATLSNDVAQSSMAGSSKALDQISARLSNPSAFGFPIYSTSGFDVLSIMARVATQPNPTLKLGPVDSSCSSAIVDVRRFDSPIVYTSPGSMTLTGYAEHEVLGRNCCFLQARTAVSSKTKTAITTTADGNRVEVLAMPLPRRGKGNSQGSDKKAPKDVLWTLVSPSTPLINAEALLTPADRRRPVVCDPDPSSSAPGRRQVVLFDADGVVDPAIASRPAPFRIRQTRLMLPLPLTLEHAQNLPLP
jgi:hypothetical protein